MGLDPGESSGPLQHRGTGFTADSATHAVVFWGRVHSAPIRAGSTGWRSLVMARIRVQHGVTGARAHEV